MFTQEQINVLQVQIHAFEPFKSGLPIPEKTPAGTQPANGAIANIEMLLQGPNVQILIFDAAVKISKSSSEQPESL